MKPVFETDICPRCRKSFHCSKSAKCWCYEIDTSASLLQDIQNTYDTCLCPDCLQELTQKEYPVNQSEIE